MWCDSGFFCVPNLRFKGPRLPWTGDDLELPETPLVWTLRSAGVAIKPANKVGYLTRADGYPRGEISEELRECLVRFVRRPAVHWFGYHHCDLDPCWLKKPRPELRYKGMRVPSRCSTDFLVPDGATGYLAPALILHYILFHQYLPPACFLEAALGCPDPGSSEYLDAIERICPATLPG